MIDTVNFDKLHGLVPAIIQDAKTHQVLMLGFMDREALEKTIRDKRVTFRSRSRQTLWQKGETSGNYLEMVSIQTDCDSDTLLIKALPTGPVCHTGMHTCFQEEKIKTDTDILSQLESVILQRKASMPEKSYTASLLKSGLGTITQKVGEEAVEAIVAALVQNPDRLREESADLLYHLLVLLAAKNIALDEVLSELKKRM